MKNFIILMLIIFCIVISTMLINKEKQVQNYINRQETTDSLLQEIWRQNDSAYAADCEYSVRFMKLYNETITNNK